MQLNLPRLRLGMAGAAVFLFIAYKLMGGAFTPQQGILIEFGSDPDRFAGLDVEVDGQVVGKLEKLGAQTRTGLVIPAGTHTVKVRDPQLRCAPASVDIQSNGMKVMLLLEYEESADRSGRLTPGLVLRP
jgi:hypothetical protein